MTRRPRAPHGATPPASPSSTPTPPGLRSEPPRVADGALVSALAAALAPSSAAVGKATRPRDPRPDTRTRLLDTAEALLASVGPAHVDQVTTRAVCEAAGVTAPTLYHHFGDKDGLVAAVVARTAEAFLTEKTEMALTADPVEDVRRGWDAWVAFALAHPATFALAMGSPRVGADAKGAAYAHLRGLLERIDADARLTVPLALAADTVWGASLGVTSLLAERAYADAPLDDLPAVSATLREAVLAAVTAT